MKFGGCYGNKHCEAEVSSRLSGFDVLSCATDRSPNMKQAESNYALTSDTLVL